MLWGALSVNAVAQQPDPAIQLRQEMQREQRQESLRAMPSRAVSPDVPALNATPDTVQEPEPILFSPEITVQDNGLLEQDKLQSLLAPYRQLGLGPQRIALLLRQLNAQLVTQGQVTSKARIRHIDPPTRHLDIELMPGRIGAYTHDGEPVKADLQRAFPGQEQDLLVLQDIEQGVQQIQRLRRYQAELRILPGQTPELSQVDIHLTETRPWWFQFSGDNLGSRSTGRERVRATLNLDNTLGLLESVGLTYLRSRDSEAAVATLAIPSGYNTWSAVYAASRYRQELLGYLQEKGGSYTGTLAWNRVLHLSAAGRDAIELSLTYGDTWRKIERFTLTPARLTVLKANLTHLRQGNGWRAWAQIGASHGLPWFGATDDPDGLPSGAAHAQFTQVEAHAGLIFNIPSLGGHYVGQIDAQASRVGLYGTEQFRLAGMNAVRGYDEGTITGDSGLLFRHEWQVTPLPIKALDAQIAPLVFFDHGTTRLIDGPRIRLAGAGTGFRLVSESGRWSSDLLLAKAVDHNTVIRDNDWRAYFTFRIDL